MKKSVVSVLCAMAMLATAASARPLLDCPMRDAPFSVDGPLIDLWLSESAKSVIEHRSPGTVGRVPPFFAGTKAPTFASILTLRQLAGINGGEFAVDLVNIDTDLRALPVTAPDRIARCARYDDVRPKFALPTGKPRLLLFEKMTGFRDTPSVLAANAAFKAMAARNGWALVVTEQGGAMHPSILKQFDAVIWNNISGDVLTISQRKAFRRYVESGGGFVAVHGSAGDPVYFWDWYADTLIGARFIGHPSEPQFQDAQIKLEGNATGIGTGLGAGWKMHDEWYSFDKSPRLNGAMIVATLDESSYAPGQNHFGGVPLAMGADHPIAWARCIGKGHSFYSAIGHRPEIYSDAIHIKLLEQAILWASSSMRCHNGEHPR